MEKKSIQNKKNYKIETRQWRIGDLVKVLEYDITDIATYSYGLVTSQEVDEGYETSDGDSYYVRKLLASVGRIFFGICAAAFLANVGLFIFGSINEMFDLKILSIVNMLLLSFVLLREPKK
mgnify:CR=1 FL=1